MSVITPVFSAIGDERPRHAQAIARMVPAQQRFGADDFAAGEAQLGLESEQEFAALDGFGQRPSRSRPCAGARRPVRR